MLPLVVRVSVCLVSNKIADHDDSRDARPGLTEAENFTPAISATLAPSSAAQSRASRKPLAVFCCAAPNILHLHDSCSDAQPHNRLHARFSEGLKAAFPQV